MKATLNPGRQIATLLALPVSALLTCGCVTPELWKHTAARDWCPQSPPDEFLATTTDGQHDVVVVFHQSTLVHNAVKTRPVAWRLSQSTQGIAIGPMALRPLTNGCDRVEPMRVCSPTTILADATSKPPGCVVWEPSNGEFTVYLEGCPSGPFALPKSHQERETAKRVVVTPFAVAADAIIVGTICAGLAAGAGSGIALGGL